SAFIYGLMQGFTIPEAMRFGGASASIVISKHSSSDAMPTVEEIKQFMDTAEEVLQQA
ncbi:MAG: 5-dehydro-2-deoxygluconokinase, partial [Priestia megaterium]